MIAVPTRPFTASVHGVVPAVFRCFWEEGVKDRMPRAEQWLDDNAALVAAAVTPTP